LYAQTATVPGRATIIHATSPVTKTTYSMACTARHGLVVCKGGKGALVTFPAQPHAAPKTETPAPSPESSPEPEGSSEPQGGGCSGGTEGAGSLCHAEDGKFCSEHRCIANFPDGAGEVVECSDGEWSHSGGRSGACSHHGGEANKP
jgi:hypothetical protein